jgi:lactate dehydrogenase-like 2-hydroxyacid dehydrogenase
VARVLISTPILGDCLQALAAHELVEGAPGSDAETEALLCAPTQLVSAEMIEAMPALRAISVAGAGSDALDSEAAERRSIVVMTAGEALVETTADLAFGLLIAACRQMHDVELTLREGRWQGWRFDQTFGRDVHGATLGLVGFGAIGRAVARRAEGFGIEVLHHARHPTGQPGWREQLDELLGESDIVSLHIPLTGATLGLIDRRRIGLMREGAVLVNTARGAVLDEDALAEALEEGRLLAAGLDVYIGEPAVSPRLLAAPRTVLLPHVGSATAATRQAMLRLAAEKAAGFLRATT